MPILLLSVTALAIIAAAIMPLVYARWPRVACAAACSLALVLFCGFVALVPAISEGRAITGSVAWFPALGISAAFRIDGLGALFALLITGIGVLVLAYAPSYLDWQRSCGRLLGLLLAFMVSMLGLVLADDAITMFVFWELTSISSFFLIAFDSTSAESRAKARQALLVTSGGGLALLVGLVLAAHAMPDTVTSFSFSALDGEVLRAHGHYVPIVLLVAAGAFTKSAQVPFQFWLPGAMVAPTPVSAYLHSATMVNAGIYVLARLHPSLGGTALWTGLLGTVGALTLLTGALLAIVQRDLKRVLAYATVAILGALTMLIGLGSEEAIVAAIVLLVAHAAYKATLFLVAGNLAHQRGTRDPFAVADAAREMPVSGGAALLAAASMSGVPLLFGFLAKDALFAATLYGPWPVVGSLAMLVGGAALAASSLIAGVAPFFRQRGTRAPWRDAPWPMLAGPAVLAGAGVAFGLAPGVLVEPIAVPAAAAIAGTPVELRLAAWSGLEGVHGLAFLLGLLSLVAGALVYLGLSRHLAWGTRVRARLERWSASGVFEATLRGLQASAEVLTRSVQHGRLHGYIATVILATVTVVAIPLLLSGSVRWDLGVDLTPHELALVMIAAGGAITASVVRDRLASVAALGASGFAIAFLYALFSGPDLAITQLTVETMLVILLVLVFRRLPRSAVRRTSTTRSMARLVVSTAGGLLVTLLLLSATAPTTFGTDASHAQIHLAGGQSSTNVVNAILVNFRAIDTLGEITVLAIAGVGVLSLLGFWARPKGG